MAIYFGYVWLAYGAVLYQGLEVTKWIMKRESVVDRGISILSIFEPLILHEMASALDLTKLSNR
jgi:hypothetical protein